MSEILHIFHQSPPSHQKMHTHIQRDVVNVESQLNWSLDSDFSTPGSYGVTDHFQCYESGDSCFTDFSSSSIDELSKVTAIFEQNQSLKKRKHEFDVVQVDSEKHSVECDSELIEPPRAKKNNCSENSKAKMDMKRDYIHVRARRGQATDSHSLAERARRERIKNKMQYLQDLVPGCNKMTNKAAILDEIITYVQCLQSDVEILTTKLAASTTSVDLKMDNSLPEEVILSSVAILDSEVNYNNKTCA